jgi:hypothetical protein
MLKYYWTKRVGYGQEEAGWAERVIEASGSQKLK